MTEAVKMAVLKNMTKETDESVLNAYMELAGEKVLRQAYPLDDSKTVVPPCYESNQVEIAAYLLNKRGSEGETAHSDGGVSRSFESASVPDSMLKNILPMVYVPKEVVQ